MSAEQKFWADFLANNASEQARVDRDVAARLKAMERARRTARYHSRRRSILEAI